MALCRGALLLVTVSVVAMTTGTQAALPLPNFIKPCSRNDPNLSECALSSGRPIIDRFKDASQGAAWGLPKYRIPKLEPLQISEIKVNQEKGANSGVGIDLVAKDIFAHGLSNAEMRNISVQLNPPHFWCSFFIPRIELESKYTIDGKILILPIKGEGDANITLVNMDLFYDFGGEWEKRDDGKEYLKVKDYKIQFKSGRTYIKLTNLFNGDAELGKRMNEFLDVNWKEVTEEMGPPIADALGEVIKTIMEGFTDQVPYEYIFPEKV
ncbi:hypothetical protein J437_LFUL007988 [Ladona fulva]|uniref:Protein takeout-like n=1 Tax=Ladona fulva TaxID=123851 RepID=A0A8K0NZE2_LADFU|nr:hypothetical protein J437_LFUL007988 [Ladona fulva]